MTNPGKYCSLILVSVLSCLVGCISDRQEKFKQQIAIKSDTLFINNSRDTAIIGSKGTTIFFPKDVFTFPDGTSPKGKITIQLKECYSFPEMIREGLTTMAGDQLLETRGMVYIAAFSENKALQVKSGKSYVVHFSKDTTETSKLMNLFYGNTDKNGNTTWSIDTASILKPIAHIGLTSWRYSCISNEREDFFRFRDDTTLNLHTYFNKVFDNSQLTLGDKLLGKNFSFSFTKAPNGDLLNKKITEVTADNFNDNPVKDPEIDKYVIQFFNSIPALNPHFCKDAPLDLGGSIRISFSYFPNYRNSKEYNNLFNQKYSAFKNQAIQTINEAELHYYIFSASKLDWINCDYFWETPGEKIDYLIKVAPSSNPDIKLVFKQAKSIMTGVLQGDYFVFKNVPIGQAI